MGLFLGKGCTYDSEGALVSCVFCDIYNNKNRLTEVVFQDEKCIVFLPLDQCASHHYLVVPRTHIRNVSGLRKEHLPTLDMMLEVGQKVVRERSPDSDPSTHQYVFHVPPFNSIDHLHLHCQVPPFKSFLASQKYKPDTRWCMSFEKLRSRIEEGLTVP